MRRRSESLTAGERDDLLEHTDLEQDDLSGAPRHTARAEIIRSRAAVDELVHESSLSIAEVTELTGCAGASIRRSARLGDLYALNPGDSRGLQFPEWQFVGSQVVPGLARIITALPEGTHPLVIERFMTGTRDLLDGRSPVDWLATGGDVQKVVQLAGPTAAQHRGAATAC